MAKSNIVAQMLQGLGGQQVGPDDEGALPVVPKAPRAARTMPQPPLARTAVKKLKSPGKPKKMKIGQSRQVALPSGKASGHRPVPSRGQRVKAPGSLVSFTLR